MSRETQSKHDPFCLKFAFARGYYDGRTIKKALDLFDELELKEEYRSGVELGITHSLFFKDSLEKNNG